MTDETLNRIQMAINSEIAELHSNMGKHSKDVQTNAIMIAEGLQRALRIVEEIFLKDGEQMTDDRLKQCKCCTNYIDSDLFDEEPWCRVKPYHQMPKTKPGEPRCEHFKSPVFVCTWDEGR